MFLFGAKHSNPNPNFGTNDLLPVSAPVSTPLKDETKTDNDQYTFSSKARNVLLLVLSLVFVGVVSGLLALLLGLSNGNFTSRDDLVNSSSSAKALNGQKQQSLRPSPNAVIPNEEDDDPSKDLVVPGKTDNEILGEEAYQYELPYNMYGDDDPSKDLVVPGKTKYEVVGETTIARGFNYTELLKYLEDNRAYPVSTEKSIFNSKEAIAKFLGYVLRNEYNPDLKQVVDCYNAFYDESRKQKKEFKNVEEVETAFKQFRVGYLKRVKTG